MADLITRLLLNTQQFDNNLGKSTKQIQGFKQKIEGLSTKSISAFTKFAGAVGIAVTAGEVFTGMIRSSQTSSDLFDNTINATKGSIDALFRSLVTGDWTVFNNGIISAYSNLKELSSLMDELADKKLSLEYIRSEDLTEIENYESIAKDTNRSLEERAKAAEKMAMNIKHLSKETAEYIKSSEKALSETYKANYGINVDRETLDYFFKHTNKSDATSLNAIEKYKRERAAIEKKYTVTNTMPSSAGAIRVRTLNEEGIAALEQYDKQNEFIRAQIVLLDEVDDKRKEILDVLKENYMKEKEIYSLKKRADETRRAIKPTNTTISDVIPEGSIKELQNKIAGLKKSFENATDEGTRAGFYKAIKEAETQLNMLQLRAAGTSKLSGGSIDSISGRKIADDLKSGYIQPIPTDSIKANYDYVDSLNDIATVMGAITNLTQEGAAGWISYGTNIITAISAALPMITSLTTALTAKAAAEAAGSAASIPVIGWVKAIAAISSVVAAMAAIPKFATGGIVGGTSFTGDNMLARVNSGEMILNTSQQRNLFNLLNGGGGSKEVKFRIEGKELVGVLNTYGNKTSKYK